jgi:cytochrome c peroxidase
MGKNRLIIAFLVFLLPFTFNTSWAQEIIPLKYPEDYVKYQRANAAIELGKKLFFDRRLSGDGTMSCATCHIPEMAFSDGMDISLSYPTTKNWRNAPTLINVAFHRFFFWDGRAKSLEEQALFPVMSSFEMNLNLDYMEEKIRQVPEYRSLFFEVFRGDISKVNIAKALATFQRSLISVNAPIDSYLLGNQNALSEDAKKGYELFIGKGGCVKCHHGKALLDNRFHALGVPEKEGHIKDDQIAITRRFVAKLHGFRAYKTLKEDPGRYLISKNKKDWKAFKTPSLREVSKTAPYMHNGYFQSLEEVIDFFDKGGGKGNRVLRPLNLTEREKTALKTFLVEALTGEEIKVQPPVIP